MTFVILGCGSLGSFLARSLGHGGHRVVVIDREPAAKACLGPAFGGRFVAGVGIDLEVLKSAGIESAHGFASVTGSDDTNLAAAMIARKRFRVPSVVARVFDPAKVAPYHTAGIHVVCPPAWGYRTIETILTRPARDSVLVLGHGEVQIMAVAVGRRVRGLTVKDVTLPPDIVAVAIVRQGAALIPAPSTGLEPGDHIYLRVPGGRNETLERMLQVVED